jgi:uncharacterized protein
MKRNEIIDKIREVEPGLRETGVAALYIFGSYARDEANQSSDIDILVDAADGKRISLYEIEEGRHLLESIFPQQEVSYSHRRSIVPLYLPYIEADAIRVF